MKIKRGSTSVRRLIFIADSSSTTGAGLANLAYNTASLVAYYFAGDLSNEVAITLATATLGTWTSGGFVAVDNTNMPGWYEIGIPDAALDGGNECALQFRGAANMVPVNVYIELDTVDYQTAAFGANTTTPPTAAANASQVRTELTTELGRIDAAISTRSTFAGGAVSSVTGNVGGNVVGSVASVVGAVVLDSADKATLVDLIWDEPLTGATHNVATSSGKRLRQTTAFQQIDSTVIDASATTTTFITGLTSSVDDFYNESMLVFTDGALAGQVRAIYDYIGATKTIILEEALTSAPVNGVAFAVVSLHIHPVSHIQSGLATAAALATESTKINRIEAVATGTVTGAGTSTEVFVGPSATLTITVDSSGNRSAVVVT